MKTTKRTYSPGTDYLGDRPNLNWPAFLMRLFPEGIVDGMRVKLHDTKPRFRRTTYPPKKVWDGFKAKYVTL